MTALLASNAPAALILEDDAELASDTPALLESVDWWPAGAHVVRLEEGGTFPRLLRRPSGRTPSDRALRRLERWCPGAAAYLINRRGARIALSAFADPDNTTDHTLFDLRYSRAARRLRTVQTVPAMARQRPGDGTDQQQWRDKRNAEMRGAARRRHRLRRNFCSLPYKAQLLTLLAVGLVQRLPVVYAEAPPNGR